MSAIAGWAALAIVPKGSCPGLDALNPVCQVGTGVGSTVATAGANSVLQAVTGWIVSGATFLVDQIGSVLAATTTINLNAGWFQGHYKIMVAVAAVVVLPMVLAAIVQAIFHQSAAMLVRSVFINLPLATILTGAAIEIVQLTLAATDALSSAIASGSGSNIKAGLSGITKAIFLSQGINGLPSFVLALGALVVAFGAFIVWIELLIREAAVYVAVLFLPLALASLVWPSVSHWSRRLVDTLAALILSKFVIVAILSLAIGAVASGTAGNGSHGSGFAAVLGGGSLLILAAFSPFTLLRLIPAIEAGAVHQLEDARHRAQQLSTSTPRSAAALALRHAGHRGESPPGPPGTGESVEYEGAGASTGDSTEPAALSAGAAASGVRGAAADSASGSTGSTGSNGGELGPYGIPYWKGNPNSERIFNAAMARDDPGPNGAEFERSFGPMPVVSQADYDLVSSIIGDVDGYGGDGAGAGDGDDDGDGAYQRGGDER